MDNSPPTKKKKKIKDYARSAAIGLGHRLNQRVPKVSPDSEEESQATQAGYLVARVAEAFAAARAASPIPTRSLQSAGEAAAKAAKS